jgi:hypothetical protein
LYNTRPIEDPKLQEALQMIHLICRDYDFAGAIMLVSEYESAFTYPIYTTWNVVVEDKTLPLGFRFRLNTKEQGEERSQQLTLGTKHMLNSLQDFGLQTKIWMGDLITALKRAGITFDHIPFGGIKLPRLISEDLRRRNR